VDVLHGSRVVLTLDKDRDFGWYASGAAATPTSLRERLSYLTGDRRAVLDAACSAYVAAWKAGEVS
jgi:hypothetical protein